MQYNRSYQHQQRHPGDKHYHRQQQNHQQQHGNVLLYPTLNLGGNRGDRTMLYRQGISTPRRSNGTPCSPTLPIGSPRRSNSTPCPSTLPILPPYPPPTPLLRHHTIPATLAVPPTRFLIPPPHPYRITRNLIPRLRYEPIGNPNLRVFRLRLPIEMIQMLDEIVSHAERHVSELPGGWQTELYSLTKQDYAMNDIPGMERRIRPIHKYICKAIEILYGCSKVEVDQNQPHILKYDSDHTGGEQYRKGMFGSCHDVLFSNSFVFWNLIPKFHCIMIDAT